MCTHGAGGGVGTEINSCAARLSLIRLQRRLEKLFSLSQNCDLEGKWQSFIYILSLVLGPVGCFLLKEGDLNRKGESLIKRQPKTWLGPRRRGYYLTGCCLVLSQLYTHIWEMGPRHSAQRRPTFEIPSSPPLHTSFGTISVTGAGQ